MIKAIIFDYDGVMSDSHIFHLKACKLAAQECGLVLSEADYDRYFYPGVSLVKGATSFLESRNRSTEIDKFINTKKAFDIHYIDEVQDIPGAIEFVKKVANKYRLGIATGTRKTLLDMFLKKYGIVLSFETTVTTEEVINPKPDPESYIKATSKLKINPSECLVIEDAPSGIMAAKAAGCKVFGITTTKKADELKDADKVFESFDQIWSYLKKD